jgi:hypothetical protein
MESQSHLRDAVDKQYLTEEMRLELDALADAALGEVSGLMEYLQSPQALRNARNARERRLENRQNRKGRGSSADLECEPGRPNPEPRTPEP